LSNSGLLVGNANTRINGNMTNNPGSAFDLPGGTYFYLAGPTLTNDGTIHLNSNDSTSDTYIYVSAGGIQLTGEGELVMATAGTSGRCSDPIQLRRIHTGAFAHD